MAKTTAYDLVGVNVADERLIQVIAAALQIQAISSGPNFVTEECLRETIREMNKDYYRLYHVQAIGVISALRLVHKVIDDVKSHGLGR
jgi:hypothetical protein